MRLIMNTISLLLIKQTITYVKLSLKLVSQFFRQALVCTVIVLSISLLMNKTYSKEATSGVSFETKKPSEQFQKTLLKELPKVLTETLAEKFYRQALYFYFINKPDDALRQLDINESYFSKAPVHTSLFRAGLQISQGSHQDAQKLLAELSSKLSSNSAEETNVQKETLMIIVLLQLAEQKIAQQDSKTAQNILAKIHLVPSEYLAQYYLLQQLISWSQQPNIENMDLAETSKNQLYSLISNDTQAPYLILNEALSALSNKDYLLSEQKLKVLQNFKWQQESNSFWQQLFANEYGQNKSGIDTQLKEQEGINQYAQLLLAQVYIEQGLFQQGYNQLERFPKDTPFTEQALFLFGYSAFKLHQFSVSELVFKTLINDYPYSTFTQQAWALSAEQYIVQNKYHLALDRYLQIEKYYEYKLDELTSFKNSINTESDLLQIYQAQQEEKLNSQALIDKHQIWLSTSLQRPQLATAYQQLLSVDSLTKQIVGQQNKSEWLAQTIELNHARQERISITQRQVNYSQLLKQLTDKKEKLSALLNEVTVEQNNALFANEIERKWLSRIEKSKNSIAAIQKINRNEQNNKSNIDDYQQRLARVQGVLTWQLQQKFPQRLWQSQHSLNEFEKLHHKTMQQHSRVDKLLSQENVLKQLTNKHQTIAKNITLLSTKTQQLKERLNTVLLEQNQLFVENEQRKIKQFLTSNQRAMANVIESLNQQEAL